MPGPLQTGLPEVTLEQFSFTAQIVKALVGLTIAYIAFQGYRRNRSRPMLAISIGFVLVLGLPFVLFLVVQTLHVAPGPAVVLAAEASQIAGLFVILYALRMPS